MYGKIFGSLYEGSMRGKLELQAVFIYMLANCDPLGVIDVVPSVISDAIGIEIDLVKKCITELEGPDPESRTPDLDGARIERLDDHRTWGWRIINHPKYQRLRNLEDRRQQVREAVAKHKQKLRSNPEVIKGNQSKPTQTQTHTQTQKTKDLAKDEALGRFNVFWPIYPRKVAKPAALKAWKAQSIDSQEKMDRVMAGLKKHIELEWPGKERQHIPHPSTWLNQKRWEDDLTPGLIPIPLGKESAPDGSVEALQGRLEAARKRREEIEAEIQSVKGGKR